MRFLLVLLLIPVGSFSQIIGCKTDAHAIAQIEGRPERIFTQPRPTAATAAMDVHFYRCYWEVDPTVRKISGSVGVHFKATLPLSNVSLDLADDLIVDSVKKDDTQLSFVHANDAVDIQLASPIGINEFDSLTIFYHGVPPNNGFGSFVRTTHSGTPILWSLSEPFGSMDWWPCKNGLDDKADSIEVTLVHLDNLVAVSNGMLQEQYSLLGNKKASVWKHRYPIASYLVCFAVTNFVQLNQSVLLDGVNLPMITYCYPESENLFTTYSPPILNQLKLFHDSISPYPFLNEKYGHTQFGWGGGMEHQTNTFLVMPDEALMAHELAHQWFGDMVTCGSWEDVWLNEGFAEYFANFYMEKSHPDNIISNRRDVVEDITSLPYGSVKVDDVDNVNRIFSGRLSYNKGSYVVFMLRLVIGDDAFFAALRSYFNDPTIRYGFARTPDMKRHLEQASGKNLDQYFRQWYEGEGYPSFHAEWTPLGATHVKLKMSQTTSHPSVSFYETPIPLLFKNNTREKRVVINSNTNGQEYMIRLDFVPDTMLIDPAYELISKNNSVQKVPYQSTGNPGLEIYPNPVSGPLNVTLHDFEGERATVMLYNAVGQLVLKEELPLTNTFAFWQKNLSHLSSGVYLLKVIGDGFSATKKIIR